MTARPTIGSHPRIAIGNAGNVDVPSALIWGAAPTEAFLPLFGGDLLVSGPFLSVDSMVIPCGGTAFTCSIPDDCAQIGGTFYLQVVGIDACGPAGFSMSRGMRLHIGDR